MMRATRQHLESGLQIILGNGARRGAQLMDGKLHPQFGGLVLDDEQELVMRFR
jgi:hypothetical protein